MLFEMLICKTRITPDPDPKPPHIGPSMGGFRWIELDPFRWKLNDPLYRWGQTLSQQN